MQPEGWPGHVWLEGRTLVHLKDHQTRPSHMPRGPAAKTGEGFLNPAMAPARTRSVMLLADALENNWLVPEGKIVRAFGSIALLVFAWLLILSTDSQSTACEAYHR